MINFILIVLLGLMFLIMYSEFNEYKKKTNKKIHSLIKRMKMYEYNQNCIFDEIVNSSKGVYCHKKRKNGK